MQANWSLILNVLLLIVVFISIGRMMKSRHQNVKIANYQPAIGPVSNEVSDDIISVRKVASETSADEPVPTPTNIRYKPPVTKSFSAFQETVANTTNNETASSVMMFLLAKENRQLAGYELLQTVLAAGLRFGEGQLFHRHQSPNGQGPVMCSLAAATPSGVFDLQNIGAFSVHGLCLFMQASGNPTIDAERFAIMLDTAKQLNEGLDTHLLDDQRRPLSNEGIKQYYRALNLNYTE